MRTRKIDKMTADDWRLLGVQTKQLYNLSLYFACDLAHHIGKSHELAKKAQKIYEEMSLLKSDLDDLVCYQDDLTGRTLLGDEATDIFYGKLTDRQKELTQKKREDETGIEFVSTNLV